MNVTIHRREDAVIQIFLEPNGPREEAMFGRLADEMARTGSLTLESGGAAFRIGPFGDWHADRLSEVGPSPLLPAFRALAQADDQEARTP